MRNNSLFGNSSFLFLGRFFNNAATLIVVYFFAHELTTDQYGVYQGLCAQLNFLVIIAGISIPVFTVTYSTEKITAFFRQLARKKYLRYLIFLCLCATVFSFIQYENISQWYIVALFFIAFTCSNIADAFLIVFRKMKWMAGINFLYAVLYLYVHYLYLEDKISLPVLLLFWTFILLLKSLITIIIRPYRLVKVSEGMLSQAELSSMIPLWKQLYILDIIQITFLWVDKFIISLLLNHEQTAIYFNGTMSIPFLPIVFTAVSNAAMIHLSTHTNTGVQHYVARSIGKILSSLAFPLFIFLLFFSKEVVWFVFSDKYTASVPIFRCAICVLPFRAYNFSMLLQKNEKGSILTKGALIDLSIAVVLMYPLYLLWGLKGVALSFVFSTIFQALYYASHTASILEIAIADLFPLKNWIIKIIAFIAITWTLYCSVPSKWMHIPGFFISGTIIAIIALAIFIYEFNRLRHLEKQIIKVNENIYPD